jgi:hypothetical protein
MSNGPIDQVVDNCGHVSAFRDGALNLHAGQLVEQSITTNDDPVSFLDSKGCAIDPVRVNLFETVSSSI